MYYLSAAVQFVGAAGQRRDSEGLELVMHHLRNINSIARALVVAV